MAGPASNVTNQSLLFNAASTWQHLRLAAKQGDLRGVSTWRTNVPLGLVGVDDFKDTNPASPMANTFSLVTMLSTELLRGCVYVWKDKCAFRCSLTLVTRLLLEKTLKFCMGALRSYSCAITSSSCAPGRRSTQDCHILSMNCTHALGMRNIDDLYHKGHNSCIPTRRTRTGTNSLVLAGHNICRADFFFLVGLQ